MTWAIWLAVPVVATSLAALFTGWRGHRARSRERLDTAGAMRAHQDYLDALVLPARSTSRPAAHQLPTGSVVVADHATDGPLSAAG